MKMLEEFKRFILFSILFLFFHTGMFGQTPVHMISELKGSTLYFGNGDSLALVSLSKPGYQLIILAFHAEEDTIGLDPGLSVEGRWRAIHLNKLFKDINFKGYFTTPFRNNILTLQPLMEAKNCKAGYYDQANLRTLAENISKVFPSPVIVIVHPETVGLIFEQLTKKKFSFNLEGNLSEKIFLIQRSKTVPSIWNEFKYSIR